MTLSIPELNDTARREILTPEHLKTVPCKTVFTRHLLTTFSGQLPEIVELIKAYDDFSDDDDLIVHSETDQGPNCEREFGVIKRNDKTVFWKIDYYDNSLEYGSENPADINNTTRVLTVMMASDY